MSLMDIANQVVTHCRAATEHVLLDTIYAADVVSVEPADGDTGSRVTVGLDGIRGKHAWFAENFDVHSLDVSDPMPHGEDRFAVIFKMDISHKESGGRSQMEEVAIYTVTGGKIVREEFFYAEGD